MVVSAVAHPIRKVHVVDMRIISAPEAARYPFFAALSEWRNEMGIVDRF